MDGVRRLKFDQVRCPMEAEDPFLGGFSPASHSFRTYSGAWFQVEPSSCMH